MSLRDRIMENVSIIPITGCWMWMLKLTCQGYGELHMRYSIPAYPRAHRVSYEAFVGPIPDGLVIDHLCRHPWCVNPEHLEPVTQRENTARGDAPSAAAMQKTHCLHGHELTEPNARVKNGRRMCRACGRAKTAAYELRQRQRSPGALLAPPAPKTEGGA